MATLEKIRSKAGILISIVIGLALIAFILGDFLSQGSSFFNSNDNSIAKIGNNKVSYQDFMLKTTEIEEIYKFNFRTNTLDEATVESIREQVWTSLTKGEVMKRVQSKTGLDVGADELNDLITGANPHMIIRQIFGDKNTGQINKDVINAYWQNEQGEPAIDRFTLYLEAEIRLDQMETKYRNMISKGLYVTALQIKTDSADMSQKTNMQYVFQYYSAIPDSLLKYTAKDLKAYYKKNKHEYQQEDSRSLKYVAFNIKPSDEDTKKALDELGRIKTELDTLSSEIPAFVSLNSDGNYDKKFYKVDELSDTIKYLVRNGLNSAVGPYLNSENYRLSKIAEVKQLPDSVKARHIIIRPSAETQEAVIAARKQADSIKNLLETKKSVFEVLYMQYNADGASAQSGDLGWFNEQKAPFADSAFAKKVGDIFIVGSNDGFHIVEVTGRGKEISKYQIAHIDYKLAASSVTEDKLFQDANNFLSNTEIKEKFEDIAKQSNYQVNPVVDIKESEKFIYGLEKPGELIRWAFESEESDVSKVFRIGQVFVVAQLSTVKEEGIAPYEQVQAQVEAGLKKELKAKMIADKVVGSKSLKDVAGKFEVPIQDAIGLGFNASSLQGVGMEPKVIGAAVSTDVDKLAGPINGNSGVFFIYPTQKIPNNENSQMYSKYKLNAGYSNKAGMQVMQVMQKIIGVKDMRYKFL